MPSYNPMSDEEFVEDEGEHCPFCRALLFGEPFKENFTKEDDTYTCKICGKGWIESYELVGFYEVDEEDPATSTIRTHIT
jgi:hypothetical protein